MSLVGLTLEAVTERSTVRALLRYLTFKVRTRACSATYKVGPSSRSATRGLHQVGTQERSDGAHLLHAAEQLAAGEIHLVRGSMARPQV
jgi:hypothetical protein